MKRGEEEREEERGEEERGRRREGGEGRGREGGRERGYCYKSHTAKDTPHLSESFEMPTNSKQHALCHIQQTLPETCLKLHGEEISFLVRRRMLLGFLKRASSSSGFFSGFLSKETVSAFCFWRKRSWRLSNIRPPSPSLDRRRRREREGGRRRKREREGGGERERGGGRRREKEGNSHWHYCSMQLQHGSGHARILPCELDGVSASIGDEGVKVGLHGVVVALGAHLTLPQGYTYTGHK